MRTTEQWWDEVSNDPAKMAAWLKDQYYGEQTAAVRVRDLLTQYPDITDTERQLVTMIADDEAKHAKWVLELLLARGIHTPELYREKPVRYWDKTLPTTPVTFSQICAIGHHAEVMRLERIRLLADDVRFNDIAQVFTNILSDEVFHAKAFGCMSSPEDIEAARGNHEAGKQALGLVA
jgi:tRNA isopentenyl-2-thiomethyl-A-37 hydroxylase MiaE